MYELYKGFSRINAKRVAIGSGAMVRGYLHSQIHEQECEKYNMADSTIYATADTKYYLVSPLHRSYPERKVAAQQMEDYIHDIYHVDLGDALQIGESYVYIELSVAKGDFKIRHKIDYTEVLDMDEQERYHLVDHILAKAFMGRYAW